MFPEGTRNMKGSHLLPFKKGAFHMAKQCGGIKLMPVVVSTLQPRLKVEINHHLYHDESGAGGLPLELESFFFASAFFVGILALFNLRGLLLNNSFVSVYI